MRLWAPGAVLVALVAACGSSATDTSRIVPGETATVPDAALAQWASFPVSADPRPLVMTEAPVEVGPHGFLDGNAKLAFGVGAFIAPAGLTDAADAAGGLPTISSKAAYELLVAESDGTVSGVSPTPIA